MEFKINAGTLFVGALIFVFAVFLKPMVMVIRDIIIWWWIEKYLINQSLYILIDEFSCEQHMHECSYRHFVSFNFDEARNEYILVQESSKIEPIVLSPKEHDNFIVHNNKRIEWHRNTSIEIKKKSHLFDLLMRYYDQSKNNPIDEYLAEYVRSFKKDGGRYINHDETIEYIISESMQNPAAWRAKR